MKEIELKPCPFCGGEPQIMVSDGSGNFYSNIGTVLFMGRRMTHKIIRCKKCRIKTQPYLTDRGVFNAWNRRADNEQRETD